jgi:hypothetical protein
VDEDRWAPFIEWARRARAKPAFDLEERVYRMGIAAAMRDLLDAASERRPLGDRLTAAGKQIMNTETPIVPTGQLRRLVEWAESDEQGFARALRDFIAEDDPLAGMERFILAIERGPGAERFVGGGLVVASLLSFTTSPEPMPCQRVEQGGAPRAARLGRTAPPRIELTESHDRSTAKQTIIVTIPGRAFETDSRESAAGGLVSS